jgi:hypothetical protein
LAITCYKDWLRIGVVGGTVLFGMSGVAFSKQNPQSTPAAPASSPNAAQASASPAVDWSIFLPMGDGQSQTSVHCAACHSLQAIVQRRSDEAGWSDIVDRMISTHSAPILPDDATAITKYLAAELTPSTPKLELPIHINIAPKDVLTLMGNLSADDVQKIMDARSKEKIRDFAALETLLGEKKVAKYKSVILFD